MEKGKLIVNNKGNAKVKRVDKKEVPAPKEYNYSAFIPQSGKNRLDCEYELNDIGHVIKVFVNGKELLKDTGLQEEKEKKEERKRKNEEAQKKEAQEKKQNASLIQKMKNCSFNLNSENSEFYLPKDTYDVLVGNEWRVDNFSLRLKRGARYDSNKNNFTFYSKGKHKIQENFGNLDFQKICSRLESQITYPHTKLNFSPDWRLIVGLGDASVYETSIALHHIYGIPYIPASTVKGVVRSYIIKEVFLPKYLEVNDEKANEKSENDAMNDSNFKKLFGNQEQKGRFIFYDAFPTSAPKIEVDVMNPHYGSYYSDNGNRKAPVDSDNPIPIFFLTVADCDFQFIIASKDDSLEKSKIKEKTITQWLKEALTNHGIGAKTAVGYGYMEETN